MLAVLNREFLKLFLIGLVPGYFAFLLASAVLDRQLSSFCKLNRIEKHHRFIVSNRVPSTAFEALLSQLERQDARGRGLILWLRTWRFASDVFLWLFVVVWALGALSLLWF